MLTPQENDRLTRVGPGTPMGNALRRYWWPAALSRELPEPDGAPLRVRLLGEDLIAFRDTTGQVGLVDAFCPHRRAPMFFGRNEACGLRCVYHGWKFDRNGTCTEMPSEPEDSLFRSKVTITAYPTWEGGGYVWAYLGPREHQPAPPEYEFVRAPETHRMVSKTFEECNWVQALDGGLDTTHTSFLHRGNVGGGDRMHDFASTVPQLEVETTDYGYMYTGIRVIGEQLWVRGFQYIMPAIQMRGSIAGLFQYEGEIPRIDGHVWVPIDDEHTWVYHFMYAADPSRAIPLEQAIQFDTAAGRGPDDQTPDHRPKRNKSNDYLIDRTMQKTTNYTGIVGVSIEDYAVQEGMEAIVDRSREHLGTTDRPVIVMRRLLLEASYDVEAGRKPRGSDSRSSRNARAFDHMIPRSAHWRDALAADIVARY
jgi:phthalate 4,5-dioxygenase